MAKRSALDAKVNAALSDDFWEDGCDYDLDNEDEEVVPVTGTTTLLQTAVVAALEETDLSEELRGSVLGRNPQFRTDADRIQYILDREIDGQYLEAKTSIQGILMLFQHMAVSDGFEPRFINDTIRGTILKLAFKGKADGMPDILASQVAYKVVNKTLVALEYNQCYYPLLLGVDHFTRCVGFITDGNGSLRNSKIPSLGTLLWENPQRSPITNVMVGRVGKSPYVDEQTLLDCACLVVSRANPLHVRLLFEKSSVTDHYRTAMPRVRKHLREKLDNLWLTRQVRRGKFRDDGWEPDIAGTRKRGIDPRSISFSAADYLPQRDSLEKTLLLNGKEVLFRAVPNGQAGLAWFPMNAIAKEHSNHGLHLVDDVGLPLCYYTAGLLGIAEGSFLYHLQHCKFDNSCPNLDKEVPLFFREMEKWGMSFWDKPFHVQLRMTAGAVDVLLDRDPRGPADKLVSYLQGRLVCPVEPFQPFVGRRLASKSFDFLGTSYLSDSED
jgi:hypothetical protein